MSHTQTNEYIESIKDTFYTYVENRAWDKVQEFLLALQDSCMGNIEIELVNNMEQEDIIEYNNYLKKTTPEEVDNF